MKTPPPSPGGLPADRRYGLFNTGPDPLWNSMDEFDAAYPEPVDFRLDADDDPTVEPAKALLPEVDELQEHASDLLAVKPSRRDSQDNDDDVELGDSGEPIRPIVP